MLNRPRRARAFDQDSNQDSNQEPVDQPALVPVTQEDGAALCVNADASIVRSIAALELGPVASAYDIPVQVQEPSPDWRTALLDVVVGLGVIAALLWAGLWWA